MSDLSWLNPTPHAIAVYASQPPSPVATQHSLPSRTLPFTWAGLSPAGSHQLCLAHSFDHLVGAGKQRRRNFEAERHRGLDIDHKFKLDWRLDGKLARFRAPENAISIRCRTTVLVEAIRTIRDQATDLSKETGPVDCGNAVASSQRSNLRAVADYEGIRHDDQTTIRRACLCG